MQFENDLILRAAKGEFVERPPVWLMRQAGRILPEYRAVRAKMDDFVHLVQTPERAAEVSQQPVDILGVDAAIIFSDILVVPEAMGMPYTLVENEGPVFQDTIKTRRDIENLHVPEVEDKLHYTPAAIDILKKNLKGRVPIIGFAGAPWTLMAYMLEGRGSKTFNQARKFLYQAPELSHQLLDKITQATIRYLEAQIKAGASIIQIFDSWAGLLSPDLFATFGLPYIKTICESLSQVPRIVFTKGAEANLDIMSELPCEVLGLDWNVLPEHARRATASSGKSLQGNFDPAALYASPEVIREKAQAMVHRFGQERYIANLGHGVYPDTDPEHVKAFIEAIKTA